MGAYVVKQPNGLYARFSTIVDTVTHYNMTEDEYIQMCIDKAVEEAKREARDTLDRCLQPYSRIKEDNRYYNITKKEFKEIIKEMEGYNEDNKE